MSSAPAAALIVVLTLIAVLATSGIAKLRDRTATRDAFDALRIPSAIPPGPSAAALPWGEIAMASLLLVAPSGWMVPVAVALVLLMVAYTAVIGRALGFDEQVRCACFGSLGRHDVDRTTLGRNLLLTAMAGTTLWFAFSGGSTLSAFRRLDSAGWWTLAAAAAAAAVAALVLGRGLSEGAAGAELLDYERDRIPYGVLHLADGRTANLWDLTSTRAWLLVVLSPGCGSCVRTAALLDGLAERLAPAVGVLAIYPDEASARGATEHADELSAWDPEGNIRRGFSVGTPAAILLGADGFLAGGPVAGERSVASFFDEVDDALGAQPSL